MSLIFIHTADWHLGKPFSSVGDEGKRHRLQQQRLRTIQELAALVRDANASFVLVAGDIFDSPHATKNTVSAACAAIGAIGVPVLAIPGNHDHGGPGSIWDQEFFERERQQLAPNLQILTSPSPVVLENAVILPAPLLRRHEAVDPTSWIRTALSDPTLPTDLPLIVLAHGTVQGFGSTHDDDDPLPQVANWIDLSRLPEEGIDYIALGDWHGTKQVGPKAWYSGTPEIDRFPKGEGNDPGSVLRVTLSRGSAPEVKILRTTGFKWKQMHFHFSEDIDLDRFAAALTKEIGTQGDECLLSLMLEGSLGIDAASRLEETLESWEARLVWLKLEQRVAIAPSAEEINALTQRAADPLITRVAKELIARAAGDDEAGAVARLALRELHSALA